MASHLKQLKRIKNDIRFTVFGYLRQNENKLALFCNIPALISYLCLSYYYHGECFYKPGHDIKISDDKMRITKIENNEDLMNTSYGKTWIDPSIHQSVRWKFNINKLMIVMYIKLVSKYIRINGNASESVDAPFFAFNNCATKAVYGGESPNHYVSTNFRENEQISMIFNTKIKELHVELHDGKKILLWKNMPIADGVKYKMAITMYSKQDSISLTDFQCDLL